MSPSAVLLKAINTDKLNLNDQEGEMAVHGGERVSYSPLISSRDDDPEHLDCVTRLNIVKVDHGRSVPPAAILS
jgi:hypothetical protein